MPVVPDDGFDDLDPDPLVQFERWFREAASSQQIQEPAAMSVASSGADGPSARMVLLRGFDERVTQPVENSDELVVGHAIGCPA